MKLQPFDAWTLDHVAALGCDALGVASLKDDDFETLVNDAFEALVDYAGNNLEQCNLLKKNAQLDDAFDDDLPEGVVDAIDALELMNDEFDTMAGIETMADEEGFEDGWADVLFYKDVALSALCALRVELRCKAPRRKLMAAINHAAVLAADSAAEIRPRSFLLSDAHEEAQEDADRLDAEERGLVA